MAILIVIPNEPIRPAAWNVASDHASVRRTPRRIAALLTLLGLMFVAILAPRTATAQDSITLRPVVRVEDGKPLTLAAVADIAGAEASKLAAVALGSYVRGTSIGIDDVRAALEKSGLANMGRIRLAGASCEVRSSLPTAAPQASAAPTPLPSPATDTVRSHIPARIAEFLGVGVRDIQLTFEPGDAALLDAPLDSLTLSIQPTGSGDRIPLAVRLYDRDRLVAGGSVRVGVLVRRATFVARNPIVRGTSVTDDLFTREDRWLPPSVEPAGDSAIGQVARARIGGGEVIARADLESPIIVKRGELVTVDCISGGFMVRSTARATEPGREGQVISFQSLNSKNTFRARMSKPGQAVMVLDGSDSPDSGTQR